MSDLVQIECREIIVYRYTMDRARVIDLLASNNVEDRAHLESLSDSDLIDALGDAYAETDGVYEEVRAILYGGLGDTEVISSDVTLEQTR